MMHWGDIDVNEFIITDELRGDFGGAVEELGVRATVTPRSFGAVRGRVEDLMRSTLVRSGCVPVVRIVWEDGFVPVFDDDGEEIGQEAMMFGYAFGDRLSTDRPPKHSIDQFYDEANVFSWEVAHLR